MRIGFKNIKNINQSDNLKYGGGDFLKKIMIATVVLSLGVAIGTYVSFKLNKLLNLNGAGNTLVETVTDSEDKIQSNLIFVNKSDPSIDIDLKYNSTDNVCGVNLYNNNNRCYLQEGTLFKLRAANEELMALGFRIKIWDAYRPVMVQKKIWATYPNAIYIENPFLGGSDNSKGVAVDVTLTHLDGTEIEIPYGFDEFEKKKSLGVSEDYYNNKYINLLVNTMTKHGFFQTGEMWYHFVDSEYSKYETIDVSFRDLLKK